MRLLPRILALLVCVLVPCSGAAAASPPGTLAQLAGAGGCVSLQTALGCTPARGLDDARAVALSPDGRSLYVAAATPASVTTFSVAPGNGLLQQLNLSAGCVASVEQEGCGGARALEPAPRRSRSPPTPPRLRGRGDGGCDRQLRAPAQRLARAAHRHPGCIPRPPVRAATPARRSAAPTRSRSRPTVFRYVAAATADALLVFSRDAATGRLTPLAGSAGCLRAGRANCAPVTGIDGPSAIAITPDGTSLYVSSATAGTITAFQRDVNTGTLTQLAPGAGCLSDVALADCTPIGGLARASSVVVTPDGLTVVAVGTDDDAVTCSAATRPRARSPASRASRRRAATAGCTVSPLIQGPRAVTIRPGGFVAWVASSRGDSIVTLQLDLATGALTPTAGTAAACGGWPRWTAGRPVRSTTRAGWRRAPTDRACMRSARSATASLLGPQLAPNCLPVRAKTAANTPRSVVLACSDPNGGPRHPTILRQPGTGASAGSTRPPSTTYTPAPGYAGSDSSTYTATDGLESASGSATINSPCRRRRRRRLRTARTPRCGAATSTCSWSAPDHGRPLPRRRAPARQGPHRQGYGFSRLRTRSTGRVVTARERGDGAHTSAQVVVTVRDRSRRATIVKRTILILP